MIEYFFPGPAPNPHLLSSIELEESEDSRLISNIRNESNLETESQSSDVRRKYSENHQLYLDIYKKENMCLMISYFSVGFALYFSSTPINYYLVYSLGASSTQTSVLATVTTLPWSFKIIYGLLSDSVPILGYRRKPYFFLGMFYKINDNFSWSIVVFIIRLVSLCGF